MSRLNRIALSLIILAVTVAPGCGQSSSPSSPNLLPFNSSSSAINDVDAGLKIQELTDTNAAQLLLSPGAKSVVIAYSSKEASAAQTEQLELMARDSHNYAGVVNFYRLDQAKYPNAWSAITRNASWDKGPYFLMVYSDQKMVITVADQQGKAVHAMTSDVLSGEVNRSLKVKPPVFHVTADQVDRLIHQSGRPVLIMAYRNNGPQNITAQFQRFAQQAPLYAGRVNFLLLDLDQTDISDKLGMKLPKQNDPYYVVYDPSRKVGYQINNALLSDAALQDAIRSYFGPGHEPVAFVP
jgi:hypothetical protein